MRLESNRSSESLSAQLIVFGLIALTLLLSRAFGEEVSSLLFWGCNTALAAGALFLIARAVLRLTAGRTILELDEHPLVRGQSTGLRIYQEGGRTVDRLSLRLSCATERAEGMDIESVRVRGLYSEEVMAAEGLKPEPGTPLWEGELRIPADAGGSTAVGEKWWRTWGLELEMRISGRISIREVYTIEVDDPAVDVGGS